MPKAYSIPQVTATVEEVEGARTLFIVGKVLAPADGYTLRIENETEEQNQLKLYLSLFYSMVDEQDNAAPLVAALTEIAFNHIKDAYTGSVRDVQLILNDNLITTIPIEYKE